MLAPLLGNATLDEWHFRVGDPTVMAWVIVFGYFLAALLCFRTVLLLRRHPGEESADKKFWVVLFLCSTFLGFNKQLDLHTLITITGRKIALAQGWYQHRRIVQGFFLGIVAICGVFGVRFLLRVVDLDLKGNVLAGVGALFLIVFVVSRAASFHHLDYFLRWNIGGMRLNWIFELGGIALISAGAVHRAEIANARPIEPGGRSAN